MHRAFRRVTILCLCAGAVMAEGAIGPAAGPYYVNPGESIQAVIDAAIPPAEIVLAPGTYVERIDFRGLAFTVRSTDPSDPAVVAATIIDGDAGGSVVTFDSGEESDSVLAGFTITNGTGTLAGGFMRGGGIYCGSDSSPTISRNIITGNAAGLGAGIACYSSDATIVGNTITGNSASSEGGGIDCDNASPLLTGNTISGNAATTGGGGISLYYASPTITNSIVAFATAGGGVYLTGGTAAVTYCDVYGNVGGEYVGLADPTGTNGNIAADPLFADAAGGDFHLKSGGGRWHPGTAAWVTDHIHSPCIDAGDPASPYASEPAPNGGRINMGAHGNTPQASKAGPPLDAVWVDDDWTGETNCGGHVWQYNAFSTIQAGIDRVVGPGGTVEVHPGTYTENIDFVGKAITVCSTDPANASVVAATIIDGGAGGTVVSFVSGEGLGSALSGFTITNGFATRGGGILCDHSSPTIEYNVITGNAAGTPSSAPKPPVPSGDTSPDPIIRPPDQRDQAAGRAAAWPNDPSDDSGGGIYCWGSTATIRHNTIAGNTASGAGATGAGVYCCGSNVTIEQNVITGNTSELFGGGIFCGACDPVIQGNLIGDNTVAEQAGAGICCVNSGAEIRSNTITGNSSAKAAGLALITFGTGWPAVPTIQSNALVGNACTVGGGAGVDSQDCSPILRHNTIANNAGPGPGGGILCIAAGLAVSHTNPVIENNSLYGNGASLGGGIGCWDLSSTTDCSPTIRNSIIACSTSGGGIGVTDATPSVSYCDGYDNTGGNYVGMPDVTDTNGNIAGNPLFANAAAGDYHLRSRGGRWDPVLSGWVIDPIDSACIDAGDPASGYGNEPGPNGGRVNMGAYGNTTEASKTANRAPTAPTSVQVAPSGPTTLDDLTASADGSADADGDSVTYEYEWACTTDGGANWSEWQSGDDLITASLDQASTVTGDTLDHRLTARGEEWKARARASDGAAYGPWAESDPVTIGNSPPTLAWVGMPGFLADGHDPGAGAPDTTEFAFRAKITDPDDTAPAEMTVEVQRVEDCRARVTIATLALSPLFGTWDGGMMCGATATLPNGAYRYRFYAEDDEGAVATGDPATWSRGPKLIAPPQLWCTGLPGRKSDYLAPETGIAEETRFKFSVQYTDGEGDAPVPRRIEIQRKRADGTWRRFCNVVMTAWGGGLRGGKYYNLSRKLPAGEYRHRFVFGDDDGPATGSDSAGPDATQWQSGPVVSEASAALDHTAGGQGALLTSLAARPSSAGAQIVFSLSAPAQVEARILNVAGRPVKTLCQARDCDAGANALLWNARSDTGLPVPNGTYLIEVMAKAEDGAQARALAQVRIGR